jgi:hypothetical protein
MSLIYTPAINAAGDAMFFTGDAICFTSPVTFNAAGVIKNTGGFTRAKTWCTHEGAAGSLRE